MSNSGGPSRRARPEKVSGQPSGSPHRGRGGGEYLRSRTLRRRHKRFVDLWSDGRTAMARPGRSAEASFTARPAVSVGALKPARRTPSMAARGSSRRLRARLQRETLSGWRRIFSEDWIVAIPDRPSCRRILPAKRPSSACRDGGCRGVSTLAPPRWTAGQGSAGSETSETAQAQLLQIELLL